MNEDLKTDNGYWNGCFWVIANSFTDIILGNFDFICDKYLVDEDGNSLETVTKKDRVHKNIWDKLYKTKYLVDYNYYPRGRVQVYNKKVYININPIINIPKVIDKIYEEFDLLKVNRNDINFIEETGEHYKHQLI